MQHFPLLSTYYVSRKLKLITIHSLVIKTEKNICQELWHLNRNEITNTMAIVLIPLRFLWLTLLAVSSASSAYVQYASRASSLPPRYPLKSKRGMK